MPDEPQILRIGDWRVDPGLDELSREGETIRLEPRTMRLLLYLAAHAGRVVDVQHLLNEVWPNVIVTQGSVYQAIADLRRMLGDDRERPSYIENLPRRGYRLIAPVAPWGVGSTAADNSSPATQSLTQANGSVGADPQLASGALGALGTLVAGDATAVPTPGTLVAPPWRSKLAFGVIGALLAGLLTYFTIDKFWISRQSQIASHGAAATEKTTSNASVTVEAVGIAFNPPPHSIAVLPFVNLSGDKEQEYFSDGLTEEVLNSLAAVDGLQVAARTSSFYFKGEHADLTTITHKLNVATVLEGSVRRSEHTVRVSAQLINAVTGFHLWSKTYDRDIGDVLKLQTEIATAVAEALKVTLLGDISQKIELGSTRNPAALDAYLHASNAWQSRRDIANDAPAAIAAYTEVIRLDPNYALAFAGRSRALAIYAGGAATGPAIREGFEKAERDAQRAIALAPELAQAHSALAYVLEAGFLDFARANEEYERAVALAPGNAQVLRESGGFAASMGHFDAAIDAARRAVLLDPLARASHTILGEALYAARRYGEAATAYAEALNLNPDFKSAYGEQGLAFYGLGDFENARISCEAKRDFWLSQWCLAVVYDKLGRHADAEVERKKCQAAQGDGGAYQYAAIYAQWGDRPKALEWLDTAIRRRDPGLIYLKTDPLMDPLRKEPRFQAIERELKFPN